MPQWRIDQPQSLDLDGVRALNVRLVAGSVDVVGRSDGTEESARTEDTGDTEGAAASTATGAARVEVTEVEGTLIVSLEDGTLSVHHERLTWGGLLEWSGNRRARAVVSISVPSACPVELGVVSADAVVSGIEAARTAVKSVSGDVTLDGVRSDVTAQTVSGDVETRQVAGALHFSTVSGDLTVVDGTTERLRAETVSGDLTLDLHPADGVRIDVSTVSGDLTVRVPEALGFRVDVKTMSGSLESAFAGVTADRKPGRASMHGTVGTGQGQLTAKTVSGDVTLLRGALA